MLYDLSKDIDVSKSKLKLEALIKSGKVIELTEKRKKRTVDQNAYLHVAINLYAIESGYNKEEAKTELKRQCSWMRYAKNGSSFLKETKDLNTKEMGEFIDFVIEFCGQQGIYIPTPEEYIQNQVEINKQIEINKAFLQ